MFPRYVRGAALMRLLKSGVFSRDFLTPLSHNTKATILSCGLIDVTVLLTYFL